MAMPKKKMEKIEAEEPLTVDWTDFQLLFKKFIQDIAVSGKPMTVSVNGIPTVEISAFDGALGKAAKEAIEARRADGAESGELSDDAKLLGDVVTPMHAQWAADLLREQEARLKQQAE